MRGPNIAPLPGGDFSSVDALKSELKAKYEWLPEITLKRFVRTYGTRAKHYTR